MAIDLLVFFVAELPGEAATQPMKRKYRRWRFDSFFAALPDVEKRAFLEVVAAATLHDGAILASEAKWLEHRGDDPNIERVASALEAVESTLARPPDPDALRVFLVPRVELLDDEKTRETALVSVAGVLCASGAKDWKDTLEIFAAALRIPEHKVVAAQVKVTSPLL